MATPETSSSEFDAMKTLTEYTTRATEVTAQSLHYFGEQTSDFLRNSTHEEHLKMYLAFEALISFGFLISAFVLSTNSYAGFTTIFTGLVFCGYVGGTYYGLKYHKCRTVYGAVMGAGVFLVVLALETAIFWGEYSKCDPTSSLADRWNSECGQVQAMQSACVFAVFMFLSLLGQLVLLYMYKDAILGTGPLNEGVGGSAPGGYNSVVATEDTVSISFNAEAGGGRQHLTSVEL